MGILLQKTDAFVLSEIIKIRENFKVS